jgi:hypothetical protein
LEEKFKNNQFRKTFDKTRVKNAIDRTLLRKNPMPLNELARLLEKEGIHTVFRRSTEGQLYGITYIDHTTKNIFNGSSLGKQYSAKAIEERCELKIAGEEKRNQIYDKHLSKESLIDTLQNQKGSLTVPDLVKILNVLIQVEYSTDYIPNQLKNKRKKKRRGLSRN